MKKLALLMMLLVLACTMLSAADVALHGYLSAQYKFDFSEGEDPSHSYGIEGSVFGVTIELNKLSLDRKGDNKPYVELALSATLSFKVDGGLIYWGSYGYSIPGTALKGNLLLSKFNLVGDFLGEEYVIDLIHNSIGGDWAKSTLSKYYYTKYNGDPDKEEDIPHAISFLFPMETPMTFSNYIGEYAKYNPGITVTWKDWSLGIGFNGVKLLQQDKHNMDITFGITTPEFKFDDNQGSVKFAMESLMLFFLTKSVNLGGSVKASWGRDRLKLALESDFGWTFIVADGEYEDVTHDVDVHFLAEAGVASLEFYFTTLTPLLGYRLNVMNVYPSETENIDLVYLRYYSDARLTFDFHKGLEKEVPIKVYVTAYDMFISRFDDLRTDPFEQVVTGDHGRFTPFTGFASERYGRDLDLDFETDAFAEHNISSVHIYAHKLLQTVQVGAKLKFRFGNLTLGTEGYYDFTEDEIFAKVTTEYITDDIRGYAMALVLVVPDDEWIVEPVSFGCIAGLSSDTLVDFATVGMQFRWDMFDFYSSAPSIFRDFTVYCTVDF